MRGQENSSVVAKAWWHGLAGIVTSACVGALLGWFGTVAASGYVLFPVACVLLVMGGIETTGRRVHFPELDRETPQRWMHKGPTKWALLNGGTLGLAFWTRMRFLAVPAGLCASFALADPVLSAMVGAVYGLSRTATPGVLAVGRWNRNGTALADLLGRQMPRAIRLSGFGSTLLGLAILATL